MTDQAHQAEHDQPQCRHGEGRQREPGDEREDVVIAVQRPVPEEVVADSEPGHEDQGSWGHGQTLEPNGDRLQPARPGRATDTYDRSR